MRDPAFYRSRSFWFDDLRDDPLAPRPGLGRGLDVDVAIVGAGFTGLWTAYYLTRAEPGLRIAVLEAEIAGFGASGRNGGWCSALLPMGLAAIERSHGRAAAIAMQRAMFDTVDEVGRVAAEEGIDADFAKGGYLSLATAAVQVARLRARRDESAQFGFGDGDLAWLDRDAARARVGAAGALGALFTPHCAAIQPAALARGLARAVEARGVPIFERTRVRALAPGRVHADDGLVRAEVIVRATEAYTGSLRGQRRAVAPVYSLMVVTEPLSAHSWQEIGLDGRPTFDDARHLVIYGQRTAGGRLAFGGRGAPYHFGSRLSDSFERDGRVHAELHAVFRALFPVLGSATLAHAWGGPLAIPRDWRCSVGLDRALGLAWAGGYVGDGVATANLAGRTLADLITGRDSDLVHLAWVGHRSRRWEPEPLWWLGINAALKLTASADRAEEQGRAARWRTSVVSHLTGH